MTRRKRRAFTLEFKLELVQLYESGKSRSDIAKDITLRLQRLTARLMTIIKLVLLLQKITDLKKKQN